MTKIELKSVFYWIGAAKQEQPQDLQNLDDPNLQLPQQFMNVKFSQINPPVIHAIGINYLMAIAKLEDDSFNYYSIGKLLADSLLKDKFMCFTVSELSLFLIRIFNYNIIKAKYMMRLFTGFFEALSALAKDSTESKVCFCLMEQFFKFNVQNFLKEDQEVAQNLVKNF